MWLGAGQGRHSGSMDFLGGLTLQLQLAVGRRTAATGARTARLQRTHHGQYHLLLHKVRLCRHSRWICRPP